MSLLVLSNLVLIYWVVVEKFGWQNGYSLGDFLFYITFFPGLFVAPVAAILGFYTAVDFMRVGQWMRTMILAFLTGGASLCAIIAWQAFLSGGR